MREPTKRGINGLGLDATLESEELRKSNLLLEAQFLRAQQRADEAAVRFAEAAELEERLGAACEAKGLIEKSLVHWVSAQGCWAQAGNFHEAITVGTKLLSRADLPERLRQQVREYTDVIRQRRAELFNRLALATADEG